jgi:hypothetical protein
LSCGCGGGVFRVPYGRYDAQQTKRDQIPVSTKKSHKNLKKLVKL